MVSQADNVQGIADKFVGNWKKFDSFSWSGMPDCADECGIYYVGTRDSGLLEESNSQAIQASLEQHMGDIDEGGDIRIETHSHYAFGWIEGLTIRVYRCGVFTKGFLAFVELLTALESYPILDEQDWSRREYEATLESISEVGGSFVSDDVSEGWQGAVFSALDDRQVESRDGNGGYPEESAVRQALGGLGYLDRGYVIEDIESSLDLFGLWLDTFPDDIADIVLDRLTKGNKEVIGQGRLPGMESVDLADYGVSDLYLGDNSRIEKSLCWALKGLKS